MGFFNGFQCCFAGKHRRTSGISAMISWRQAKMWLAYRWGPIREPVRRAWATEDPDRSCKITVPHIPETFSAPFFLKSFLLYGWRSPYCLCPWTLRVAAYEVSQTSPGIVFSPAVRTSTTQYLWSYAEISVKKRQMSCPGGKNTKVYLADFSFYRV